MQSQRLSIADVEFKAVLLCEGKHNYETYEKAELALEHHRRRLYTKSPIMVYHCKECGFYHIGNTSKKG